jgi:hypothetical protein
MARTQVFLKAHIILQKCRVLLKTKAEIMYKYLSRFLLREQSSINLIVLLTFCPKSNQTPQPNSAYKSGVLSHVIHKAFRRHGFSTAKSLLTFAPMKSSSQCMETNSNSH